LLTNQIKILNDGIAAIEAAGNLSAAEKARLILLVKAVRLQPTYMILKNYGSYYPGALVGRYYYALDFFADVDEIGVIYASEPLTVSALKTRYGI